MYLACPGCVLLACLGCRTLALFCAEQEPLGRPQSGSGWLRSPGVPLTKNMRSRVDGAPFPVLAFPFKISRRIQYCVHSRNSTCRKSFSLYGRLINAGKNSSSAIVCENGTCLNVAHVTRANKLQQMHVTISNKDHSFICVIIHTLLLLSAPSLFFLC